MERFSQLLSMKKVNAFTESTACIVFKQQLLVFFGLFISLDFIV